MVCVKRIKRTKYKGCVINRKTPIKAWIDKQSKVYDPIDLDIDLYSTVFINKKKKLNLWSNSYVAFRKYLSQVSNCKFTIIDHDKITELSLPPLFTKRLLHYLRFHYRILDTNINCTDFVMYMLYVPSAFNDKQIKSRNYGLHTYLTLDKITDFSHLNFVPGTPLILRKESFSKEKGESKFLHFMIYVGCNLYLSKIGGCGLAFGTLEHILEIYNGNALYPVIDVLDKKVVLFNDYDTNASYLLNNRRLFLPLPADWWRPLNFSNTTTLYLFAPLGFSSFVLP